MNCSLTFAYLIVKNIFSLNRLVYLLSVSVFAVIFVVNIVFPLSFSVWLNLSSEYSLLSYLLRNCVNNMQTNS